MDEGQDDSPADAAAEVAKDAGARNADFVAFLKEALASVFNRRLLVPALVLLVVLTASNIVILLNLPAPGVRPSMLFLLAGLVRVLGVLVLSVGILRIAVASVRAPWRPDGSFWLSAVALLLTIGVTGLVARFAASPAEWVGLAVNNVIVTLILAPFATWIVGIATARPLGIRPRRFMHDFGRWLPPLLLWSLAVVTPMSVLHASMAMRLLRGAGDSFWAVALFDGALSAVMMLIGLGLNAAAYRRVAPE